LINPCHHGTKVIDVSLALLIKDRLIALRMSMGARSRAFHLVQGEATMATLRRYAKAVYLLVPLHLILAGGYFFYQAPPDQPELKDWAHAKWLIQIAMVGLAVVFGIVVSAFVRSNARASNKAVALQSFLCMTYISFGVLDAIVDYRVGLGIVTYTVITVAMGALSLMRPIFALLIFGISNVIFTVLLLQQEVNPVLLPGILGQIWVATAMSLGVSLAVWLQYSNLILLRRQLVIKQDELSNLADRDGLTGLYNRRAFTQKAQAELDRAQRMPLGIGLLMVDLDFFKKINDQYGHPAGDEVLKQVAAILGAGVRDMDIVGRLGGEEFIVMLPNTDHEGAMVAANHLCSAIKATPLSVNGLQLPVTASLGVTTMGPGQSVVLDDLYAAADKALYVAKQSGRDRVEYAPIVAICA
jgi:diguanylate cyclase (GGDEF)-like protein